MSRREDFFLAMEGELRVPPFDVQGCVNATIIHIMGSSQDHVPSLYDYLFTATMVPLDDFALLAHYFETLLITLNEIHRSCDTDGYLLKNLYLTLLTLADDLTKEYKESYPTFAQIAEFLANKFQKNHNQLKRISSQTLNDQDKAEQKTLVRDVFLRSFSQDKFKFYEQFHDAIMNLDKALNDAYQAYKRKASCAPHSHTINWLRNSAKDPEKNLNIPVVTNQIKEHDDYVEKVWREYCESEGELLTNQCKKNPLLKPFLCKYLYSSKIASIDDDYKNEVANLVDKGYPEHLISSLDLEIKQLRIEKIDQLALCNYVYNEEHTIAYPLPALVSLGSTRAMNESFPSHRQQNIQSTAEIMAKRARHYRIAGYVGFGLLACVGLAALGAATAATLGLVHVAWIIPTVYFALGGGITGTGLVGIMLNGRFAKVERSCQNISKKITGLFFNNPLFCRPVQSVIHEPTKKVGVSHASEGTLARTRAAAPLDSAAAPEQEIMPAGNTDGAAAADEAAPAPAGITSVKSTCGVRVGSLPLHSSSDPSSSDGTDDDDDTDGSTLRRSGAQKVTTF